MTKREISNAPAPLSRVEPGTAQEPNRVDAAVGYEAWGNFASAFAQFERFVAYQFKHYSRNGVPWPSLAERATALRESVDAAIDNCRKLKLHESSEYRTGISSLMRELDRLASDWDFRNTVTFAEAPGLESGAGSAPAAPSCVVGVAVKGRTNVHKEPEFQLPTEPEWLAAATDPGPPPLRPDGPGFMPLTAAAHWIASEGGRRSIGADASSWHTAYMQLFSFAQIYGVPSDGATAKAIPKETFASLPISYPYSEAEPSLDFGDSAFLQCQPYFENQTGLDPDGDQIFERGTGSPPIWTRLYVDSAAVGQIFPLPPSESVPDATDVGRAEKHTGVEATDSSVDATAQAGAPVAAVPATGDGTLNRVPRVARRGKKSKAAWWALRSIYPDWIVPPDHSTESILDRVNAWLRDRKNGHLGAKDGVSREVVASCIGRRVKVAKSWPIIGFPGQ